MPHPGEQPGRVVSRPRSTNRAPRQAGARARLAVVGNRAGAVSLTPHRGDRGSADDGLAANYRWLEALLAHSSDLIAVVDEQARAIYANPAAERILGFVPDEQLGRNMLELIHPDDLEATAKLFLAATRQVGNAQPAVFRFKTASDEWKVLEATATNCLRDPAIKGIVVNARDVTERTNLLRVLRTLGLGNQVLVHATNESALLAEMCRMIISSGGYLLAWVGYAERDQSRTVREVASAGRTDYLQGLQVGWGDDDAGGGPAGMAIRNREVQVVKDLHRSKAYAQWRTAADACGFRTSCALPLVVGDDVIGALMIYAAEPGAFGPSEVAVLSELADDLAYGIGRLRDAEDVARNEALLREAERLAHVGHWQWDLVGGCFEFMADEVFAIHGTVPERWGGTFEAFLALVHSEDRFLVEPAIARTLATGAAELEHRIVRPDGEIRCVRERTEALLDSDGQPVRIVGTCQDVTDQKAAETSAGERSHFLEELLEAIPVPVHYKDTNLRYLGCNEAFATSLGRSRDEIIGRTVFDLHPPDLATRFDADNRELLAHPDRHIEEVVESTGPTGLRREVETHKAVYSDIAGKPAGIVAVDFDISEMRQAEQKLAATAERLALTLNGAVTALGATAELRDPYTAGHQRRVAELACAIALGLGWDESRIEPLRIAALLHDIGKIVVPAEILSKPTRLSEPEMQLIRLHADAGADTVALIGFDGDVAEIIRQHHDRLDGSGYHGLIGSQILPGARVLAVADVMEAMVSHRPYRPGLPIEMALKEIEDGAGSRYDVKISEIALSLIREHRFEFSL